MKSMRASTVLLPRLVCLRDAPGYLGMVRNNELGLPASAIVIFMYRLLRWLNFENLAVIERP